jgi:hypothetical protein
MEVGIRVIHRLLMINYKVLIHLILVVSALNNNIAFAQSGDEYLKEFIGANKKSHEVSASNYEGYDFSGLWTYTENHNLFGIIGNEHRRIKVKILDIEKNSTDTNLYIVSGKSSVMGNVCDFSGAIKIKQIHLISENGSNGNSGTNTQSNINGIVVADYEFLENPHQKHVGIFSGRLYSKWYLDSLNNIVYDDRDIHSSGYINNAFIGNWRSYEGNDKRICYWGDYRVPLSKSDFDIGIELFRPGDNYRAIGWDIYIKAWLEGDTKAQSDELHPWWQ